MMDIDESRPYIQAALEYANGSHTFEDVKHLVATGGMQFWPGVTSAIVTELIDYPQYRVLNFFLAGGNADELARMYPAIEAWGKRNGADRAAMLGRRGWERSFLTKSEGWQQTLVAFEKVLHG